MAAATRPAPRTIRWDRLGRIALLCVLAGVVYLYIGPTVAWVSTYRESKRQQANVAELKAANDRLRARRDDLRRPATLEREARQLGMVRAGEKAYVIQGLTSSR
jgi:cell division protein FtsB